MNVHTVTPDDIEAALRRVEAGESGTDDANMLRSLLAGYKAALAIDSKFSRWDEQRETFDSVSVDIDDMSCEAEDDMLVESRILPKLIESAREQAPCADWENEL